MNWEFIIKYLPMYERAALLTVKLGLAGVICAIIVGLICAIIQYEKVPVARQIVAVYIELSRNTPLLVQLFFIYYGLPKIGIQTDPQTCGIAGLTFLGGSYMAEAFRSGLETVAEVQTESALSLGIRIEQSTDLLVHYHSADTSKTHSAIHQSDHTNDQNYKYICTCSMRKLKLR